MPGQIASPVRLGRARQGLFSPGVAELAGLDAHRIVQVRLAPAALACALLPELRLLRWRRAAVGQRWRLHSMCPAA
jgi:hypothetical protein